MADSSELPDPAFGPPAPNAEATRIDALHWLQELDSAVYWFVISERKCRRAEELTREKQLRALDELRLTAESLSNTIIEGEQHIAAFPMPYAQRMQDEMHAIQDPLIAIYGPTPTGLISWETIRDRYRPSLLSALEGVQEEARHVFYRLAAELEAIRQSREPTRNSGGTPSIIPQDKSKRSTSKGEADLKLRAALTSYHDFRDGGCTKFEPINSNALARMAGVAQSTASRFFDRWFRSSTDAKDGYSNYQLACNEEGNLLLILREMNGELPRMGEALFGNKIPDEAENPEHRSDRRRKPRGSEMRGNNED